MRRTIDAARNIDAERQIVEFLGVPLPSDFVLRANDKAELFDREGMEALMLERAPFFFIDRAVALTDETGSHSIWGIASMTIERSAGHFPDRPIVPLIELCRAMAQTGVILVSLHGEPHQAPIAIGSGPSKALSRQLIDAPVGVLIKASIGKVRLGLFVVNGVAYVDGKSVGALDQVVYALLPRTQFMQQQR